MLGCGDDVALGCIDHHDALLGGCTDIDVVEADAGSPDNHEVVRCGEEFCSDLCCGANDERRGARDDRQQLLGGLADLNVDVVTGLSEAFKPSVGDFFSDQDASHAT